MSVNPPKRPPNIEPGTHSKRTRSYRHCKYCRDSRKKCTREGEVEGEERCARCVKRNLPCSADLSLQEQMAGGNTGNGDIGIVRGAVGVGLEIGACVGNGDGGGGDGDSAGAGLGVRGGEGTCPSSSWWRRDGHGDDRGGITLFPPPPPPPPSAFAPSPFSVPQLPSSSSSSSAPAILFTNRQTLLPKPPSTISTPRPSSQASSNTSFISQHASYVSSIRDGDTQCPSTGTGNAPPESARFQTLQEKLDNGEAELHRLQVFVRYLTSRNQAANAALPFRDDPLSRAYRDSLGRAFDITCEQFANTMQKQLDFVELAPHDRRDGRLRFMLDIVRPLYQAAHPHPHTNRPSQVAYGLPKKLTITYGSVLRTLVSVCENAGNKRSAEIFLEELAALPRFARSLEDEALVMQRLEAVFQARSLSLRQSLRELEEHQNAAHAFPSSAMFSPEHLKMLSSLPAETVLKLLLNYKEDAGRQDGLGRTDLHLAVEIGDPNLFRFIYERNKQLLHERDDFCMAPFQLAALMGNPEIFEVLYNSETDKAARDVFARDALVLSSERGNDGVVKLLLDRGVNPNEGYDNSRSSPLFAAAGGGNDSTVSLLLSRNAYPLQLSFGQTPGRAAELYGHHQISQTLKDAEAKLSFGPGSQLLSDHTFNPNNFIWGRTNPGSPARFSSQNVIGTGVLPPSTTPQSATPQALRGQVSPRTSENSPTPTPVTGAKIVSTKAVDPTHEATIRDQGLQADGISELGVASEFMRVSHDSPSLQTTSPVDVDITDESLLFEQWLVRSPLVEAVDTTATLL